MPRIVRYGPFRLRKLEVAFGLLTTPVMTLLALFTFGGKETLDCIRGDGRGTCVHVESNGAFPDRVTRFDDADIVSVRFLEYDDRSGERGKTELIDSVGRGLVVFEGARGEARREYEAIESFLEGRRDSVTLESRETIVPALFFLTLGLFGAIVGGRALAQVTSIRLAVWPRSGRLTVTRRWLGIPIGTRELSLDDVDDVRVERGGIRSFLQRAAQPDLPAGRLVLVTSHGETPLSENMLVGTEPHDRAADALRAELDLRKEREKPPAGGAATPAPAPRKPPSQLRRSLYFIGGALIVGAVLQGALMLHADRTQGWLEVECAHRCRMGGMECLPGGSWSSSFDPGTVTIELWDPEAPSGWRPVTIPIELGHTTRYTCHPTAQPLVQ